MSQGVWTISSSWEDKETGCILEPLEGNTHSPAGTLVFWPGRCALGACSNRKLILPTCYAAPARALNPAFKLGQVEPVTADKSSMTELVVAFAVKVSFSACAVTDLFSQAAVSRVKQSFILSNTSIRLSIAFLANMYTPHQSHATVSRLSKPKHCPDHVLKETLLSFSLCSKNGLFQGMSSEQGQGRLG